MCERKVAVGDKKKNKVGYMIVHTNKNRDFQIAHFILIVPVDLQAIWFAKLILVGCSLVALSTTRTNRKNDRSKSLDAVKLMLIAFFMIADRLTIQSVETNSMINTLMTGKLQELQWKLTSVEKLFCNLL